MNPISQIQQNHKSIRSFLDKDIEPSILEDIIKSAHRAPTSSNLQDVTAIVVRDKNVKKEIAKLAGGQIWIETCPVFICLVMDFYKTDIGTQLSGGTQQLEDTLEALITGGLDSGIALANMMTCAQAHGLGIVPIGGIRNNMPKLAELLNLPEKCAPLVGMCVGYVKNEPHLKPRLSIETFSHNETYKTEHLETHIKDYNKTLESHWKSTGRENGTTWSDNLKESQIKFAKRHILEDLKKLGFFTNSIN